MPISSEEIQDQTATVTNEQVQGNLPGTEDDISDGYLQQRKIHYELNSPAVQMLKEYGSGEAETSILQKGKEGKEKETDRAKQIEEEDKPLEEPWIDPISAFAGGFGGAAKVGISAGAKLMPTLFRALTSGGSAAVMEYPLGAATEKVGKKVPWAAMPFSVVAGMVSGATIERFAEDAAMSAFKAAKIAASSERVAEFKGQLLKYLQDESGEIAFHGTPHVWKPEPGFPHGRPRLDKIGTGEGAQAYGHGWYSAQMEDTARSYGMPQGHGLPFDTIKYQGKEYPNTSDKAWLLYHTTKSGRKEVINGLEVEVERLSTYAPDRAALLQLDIDFVKSIKPDEVKILGGNLYTLEIPDDVIPKLLDWDKPLSEQSEYVKKAVSGVKKIHDEIYPHLAKDDPTGETLYRALDQYMSRKTPDSKKAASEYLASIGIPGNTHGGVSKGATGAKYVIWDQDVLDKIALLERNGEKLKAMEEAAALDLPGVAGKLKQTILEQAKQKIKEQKGSFTVERGGKVPRSTLDKELDDVFNKPAKSEGVLDVSGKPPKSSVDVTGRAGKVLHAEPVAELPKYAGNINLNRVIDEGGDLKQLLFSNSKELAPELEKARRGVQTWARSELKGKQYTLEDLLGRKTGQALNAEQVDSTRAFLMASTENLNALKQKILTKTATDEDKLEFMKAFNLNASIQMQAAGAAAEAGRALNIFRKMATGGKMRAKQIEDMLKQGPLDPDRLAEMLETLDDPTQVNAFVRQAQKATTFDMVLEAWINGLLSGPVTHAVNSTSNALVAMWQIPERMLASSIGKVMPGENEIKMSEALHQSYGFVEGFKDGMKAFAKNMRTGDEPDLFTKMDIPRRRAISSQNFDMESGSIGARAVDLLGNAIRVPTRFLGAEDSFFKALGYRMELHARAYRQAASEWLSGPEMAKRMQEIIAEPPEDIHMAAINAANYQTFTKELGEGGQAGMKFLNKNPALRLIVPFVRTPANIVKFAGERTPLALASKNVRAELAAGGARRDLALAKMSLGSMVMATIGTMTAQGLVTGGGPEDYNLKAMKRNTGWQPYSFKIGDQYYAFNRLEPLGMLFGIAADTAEIIGQVGEDEAGELATAGVIAFAKNITSKTWLRGLSEAVNALDDPERYGQRFIQNYASSLIPTGVAQIERSTDPALRERYSEKGFWFETYNSIKERVPGWSSSLPPRRNLWGEPIIPEGGLGPDIISPIYTSTERYSPIDDEMVRLKAGIGMPKKIQSIHDEPVQLTPKEYDKLLVLMNKIRLPQTGKNLKDSLDHLVTKDPQYKRLDDDYKEDMIRDYILEAKALAQDRLYTDSKEIRKLVDTLQTQRMIRMQRR